MLKEFNEETLKYLNSFTENEIVRDAVVFMADSPIFFLPLFLLGFWIYYTIKGQEENKDNLIYILYCTLVAITLNYIIKFFITVERPETILEATGRLILEHVPDNSFPSDHSSVGFAFAFALFFFGYKQIGYIFMPFAIAMVLSRVMAGVHWPLDVIAGCIVGLTSCFIVSKSTSKLEIPNKLFKKLDVFYFIKEKYNK